MGTCHKCKSAWTGEGQPGFREICPNCMAYLHCCNNCRFHEVKLHNECRIPNSEFVRDRVGANFCEDFEFSVSMEAVQANRTRARQSFDNLFGESAATPVEPESAWEAKAQPDDARDAFNRLFKS